MRTRMYGGVTGKAGDRLPMSISSLSISQRFGRRGKNDDKIPDCCGTHRNGILSFFARPRRLRRDRPDGRVDSRSIYYVMKTLYVKDRNEWRSWLEKNSKRVEEIWLVYYKKDSGKPRIAYEDAVAEALCFGWIDGKVKKLDEARFAQRFTPRRPKSNWSALNIKRARKLIHDGQMTAAGLEAFNARETRKTASRPTQLPRDLEAIFRKQAVAWENFNRFPPYYRRLMIARVASAKKEETRLKRLTQLIDHSAENKRMKLM